jgi:hypothetical protein
MTNSPPHPFLNLLEVPPAFIKLGSVPSQHKKVEKQDNERQKDAVVIQQWQPLIV